MGTVAGRGIVTSSAGSPCPADGGTDDHASCFVGVAADGAADGGTDHYACFVGTAADGGPDGAADGTVADER